MNIWDLTQVRSGNGDLILGIAFFLLGVNFLINYCYQSKIKYLFLFSFSWLLAILSYNSFRLQIPLLIIPLFVIFKQRLIKPSKITFFIFILLFVSPLFFSFLFPNSDIRTELTLFIYEPSISQSVIARNFQASLMKSPRLITRLFHNKVSYLMFSFIKNSVTLFSFDFLFLLQAHPWRYAVPENGLFLFITAPFLIFGIIAFGKSNLRALYKLIFLYLLFISLFPSIITYEDFPNSKHCLLALYPLAYLIAVGIHDLYQKIGTKKIYLAITITLLTLNFGYF